MGRGGAHFVERDAGDTEDRDEREAPADAVSVPRERVARIRRRLELRAHEDKQALQTQHVRRSYTLEAGQKFAVSFNSNFHSNKAVNSGYITCGIHMVSTT